MTSAVNAVTASIGGRFLLLGCADGFRAYRVEPGGPVKKLLQGTSGPTAVRSCHAVGGSVRLVAVLGETPLIAFVLDGSVGPETAAGGDVGEVAACSKSTSSAASTSRVLRLYDMSKGQAIAELLFQTAVVGIQINSKRLAVALAECIHVFDLWTLRHLAELRTTSPTNPNGLLAMSDLTTNSRGNAVTLLVFPQSDRGCGDVWVVQITEEQMNHNGQSASMVNIVGGGRDGLVERVNTLEAHRCAVVCLAMTRDGTRIATASSRGTTVKVFEPFTARLLYQFRRGITTARILSLSFDPSFESSGVRLAALSSRGTLHIFRCSPSGGNELVASTPGPSFPAVTARSFAQAKVREASAALYESPSSGLDCLKGNEVHYCFFSETGQFVWVLLPAQVVTKGDVAQAQCESGSGLFLRDRRISENTICWVLHQYMVHMQGCELVNSELLN